VDDEPIARKVLREKLDLLDDVEIVGEAENGAIALEKISEQRPDLVLLDLQMPEMGGLEVVRSLRRRAPMPVVVIVTAYDRYALQAFEAGAIDYLLKPVGEERLATPGVSADSNGLFHGLGDHASNSFSVDGQPITDQQSKVFSNQLPVDAVQSMEVIEGAPPAEFGGKTSLVIVATTRSGLGISTPHGDITTSYGTFGTTTGGFDLSYGQQKWGNFISANGLNTGRGLPFMRRLLRGAAFWFSKNWVNPRQMITCRVFHCGQLFLFALEAQEAFHTQWPLHCPKIWRVAQHRQSLGVPQG
jgi:CheY-like chemotaxis protein